MAKQGLDKQHLEAMIPTEKREPVFGEDHAQTKEMEFHPDAIGMEQAL
ncbi:hypothetical protein NKH70_32315 [Mesorhizobium sp. M0991]